MQLLNDVPPWVRWRARPLGLRSGLVLFVVLPFTVLTTLAGWQATRGLEAMVEQRMQRDIELVARSIRLPLGHALERGRVGSVRMAVESAFRIDRVYGAYVYDHRGDLVATSGPSSPLVTDSREARKVASVGVHGEFSRRGGESVFSYFVPLNGSGGQVVGLLQVTRHGDDFQAQLGQLRQRTVGGFGLVVAVTLVIAMVGHHRIVGQPIASLERDLDRIRRGERRHRLRPTGPKELRDLSAAANAMLDRRDADERALASQRRQRGRLLMRLREQRRLAAIGRLAAGVAHELGSPLNVIDGRAQRAARQSALPPAVGDALAAIRNEVGRMSHIVRQLLDFGRHNPLRRRRESVRALFLDALDGAAQRVDVAAVEVDTSDVCDALMLAVDRSRFRQALVNGVVNAIQASPGGRLRLSARRQDDQAVLLIEDNGPGAPADIGQRVFDPFFTTKSVGEGSGLGLAVAQAAVHDHGGRIQIERSTLGGACLRIVVPLGECAA